MASSGYEKVRRDYVTSFAVPRNRRPISDIRTQLQFPQKVGGLGMLEGLVAEYLDWDCAASRPVNVTRRPRLHGPSQRRDSAREHHHVKRGWRALRNRRAARRDHNELPAPPGMP
jgi:hypothetical protein